MIEPAIIDTNTFIFSNHFKVSQKLNNYRTLFGFVNMSIITYEDIINKMNYGGFKHLLNRSKAYLNFNQVIPISKEIRQLANSLAHEQNNLSYADLLVAATALKHNLVLITNKKQAYQQIQGLKTDTWSLF